MKKRIYLIFCYICLLSTSFLRAQNHLIPFAELGTPVASEGLHAATGLSVDWSVSERLDLSGGFRVATIYPYGFGDIYLGLDVFLDGFQRHWTCSNRIVYANYAPYPLSQLSYRLTFAYDRAHFRVDFGNAFAFFLGTDPVKVQLFRPCIALRGRIMEASHPWNISLIIRNFNRFESHGSRTIEWAVEGMYQLNKRWTLFAEPYVLTAGNFHGTANYQGFRFQIGAVCTW